MEKGGPSQAALFSMPMVSRVAYPRILRRPRMAAAARPNRIVIGGAGTSVPLLVAPDVIPELPLVLPEVEEDVEVEVELDVDVEDDVEVEDDVLEEVEVDDELVTAPVEVLTFPDEVDTAPVLVETAPVEEDTSPEDDTAPVEDETLPDEET